MRIPGASTDFPDELSGYLAKNNFREKLVVAVPDDMRPAYYGVPIANSGWEGCKTDSFFGDQARHVIRDKVIRELTSSKLFEKISNDIEPKPHEIVLKTEVRAFCSQVRGFIIARVAGIVALKFTLMRDGEILFDRKIEKVVTDADPEYTGSQISFIEQAMRRTMSDSLRVAMKMVLAEMDKELSSKINNSERSSSDAVNKPQGGKL